MTLEQAIKERDDWKSVALTLCKQMQGQIMFDVCNIPDKKEFNTEEFIKMSNKLGVSFINTDIPISKAIEVLQKELNKDKFEGSYYYSWQANIAMAFKDEFNRTPEVFKNDIHNIANQAAKNFLDLLIKLK